MQHSRTGSRVSHIPIDSVLRFPDSILRFPFTIPKDFSSVDCAWAYLLVSEDDGNGLARSTQAALALVGEVNSSRS